MTDYDDLCNGAGEWKNIQPVVRSALFGQAQDMIALKSYMVEFNKKIAAQEAVYKEVLVRQAKPDEKVQQMITALGDRFAQFYRLTEKRLDDLEEKYLENEHVSKAKHDKFAQRMQQLEDTLNKQFQATEKQTAEQGYALGAARTELKYLKTELKALYQGSASANDLQELRKFAVSQEQLKSELESLKSASNDAISRLQTQTMHNFDQFKQQMQSTQQLTIQQIEKIVQDNVQQIPTVYDIYEMAKQVFVDQAQNLASKNAVYQIAQKLQEKIQATQTQATELAKQVAEEAYLKNSDTTQLLHQVMQKQAEQGSQVQARLLDLAQLPQFEKKLTQIQLELAQKMDSGSLAGKSFVTTQQMEDEVNNVLRSCQKQIKAEVEGFIDNYLYRTVKSIIKAEIDIQATNQRHVMDEQFQATYEKLIKKITKEISPTEQLAQINQQCDDVRSLIDMLSNDIDFKLTKNAELQEQKLNAEISSVRHAIDSLNNVLYSQNDLVACKMKEFDLQVNGNQGACQPMAKWLWKSKKMTQQNAVVWSSEELNTLQSNFIWERSKSQILIVSAGCYQFKFAIFTRKRPTVQILVNGEPIISAMSGGVQPALYSVPKLQASQCYFCQGLYDWLYLSANSVVQLVISSEFSSCLSGFLEVVKMW